MRWTAKVVVGVLGALLAAREARTDHVPRGLQAHVAADSRRPLVAIHIDACGSRPDEARAVVTWLERSMGRLTAPRDLSFEFVAPDLIIVATSWEGDAASWIRAAERDGAPPVAVEFTAWSEGGEACSTDL